MTRWLPCVIVLFLCACGEEPAGPPTTAPPCDGLCPASQCFFGQCQGGPADLDNDQSVDLPSDDQGQDADPPNDLPPDAQGDLSPPEDQGQDVDLPNDQGDDQGDDLPDAPTDLPPDPDAGDLTQDLEEDQRGDQGDDLPEDLPADLTEDLPADLTEDLPEDQSPDLPLDVPEDDQGPDLEPGCARDDQCGEGQICAQGECEEGCRQDAECGPDEICHLDQCQTGCRQDAACPRGTVCEALACVTGCRQDGDCPSAQRCGGGQCVARGCAQDRDCAPGSWCDGAQCAPGCRDDLECGLNQLCQQETRTCEAGCRQDQDCPQGSYCDQAQACTPGCRDDGDCAQGQLCGPQRQCAPGCRDDDACAPSQYCDLDTLTCATGCRLRGCPALQICDLEARACVNPDTMCFGDDGCPQAQICEPFFCVGGCRDDDGCDQGQVCDQGQLLCRAGCRDDQECTQGQYCDPAARRCLEGCRDDASCGLGRQCVVTDGAPRCTTPACQRDEDCPVERFCAQDSGACEPGCRDDDGCPQGQRCDLQIRVCVPGGCDVDGDCAQGELCQDGACAPGCRDDQRCPQDSYCDLEQRPAQCAQGCREGACPQGQRCDPFQRFCVTPQCDGDGGCPQGQYCRDQVICEPGCRGDGDCAQGEVCDPGLRRCAPGCRQRAEADDACPAPEAAVALPDNGAIDLEGQLCDGDTEHVAVSLRAREQLTVTLIPREGVGAPTVELLDAACARAVALSGFQGDPNRIVFVAPQEGLYVVRLRNNPTASSRAWGLNLRRTPPQCPADAEEPNEAPGGLTPRLMLTRAVPFELGARAVCIGDEDWYAVQVQTPGDAIQVTLRQDPDEAPLGLGLYNDQGALLTSTQEVGPMRAITTGALSQAGRFFVRVWGQQPVPFSGLSYSLSARVGPDASCEEDALEPNDSLAAAAPLGDGSYALRLCRGRADQEWVRLDLAPGDRVAVALRYDHSLTPAGQLPATLYGPGGFADLRDFTARDGATDTDRLAFAPQGFVVGDRDGGAWWLQIEPGEGQGPVEVELTLQVEPPACDDPLERTPNEGCAQATPLALGASASGLVCGPTLDEDWFRVTAPQGRGLVARLDHLHFEGNLELEAWTPDQRVLLGFSYNAGPNLEEITLPDGISGEVCLRVFGNARQVTNSYELSVTQD